MRNTLTLAGLLLAAASAQDFPPGVLLLSQVKRHVQQELKQLPNVSCLETVEREHQPPRGKMTPLDTVRLEVLTNGEKELFASPGDRKFSEKHPISYAGSGVIGTGFFGLYLKSILVSGYAIQEYKGEDEVGGRRLAHWNFKLPPAWSGEQMQFQEGSGTVGLHGSFWADPETLDVVRLEMNADTIPPTLPVAEAVTSINYAQTRLSDTLAVLLPDRAEFLLVKDSGEVSHNRIEFTHCRSFGAESSLSFSAPGAAEPTPQFAAAAIDDTLRPLPAGLEIAVKLRTRITAGMAVGTLIDGVVAGNVQAKKGAMAIADGSPVRGRIRRLERYKDPVPHYVVALEFTEVEYEGIRYRFYADSTGIESTDGVSQSLSTPSKTEEISSAWGLLSYKTTSTTLRFSNLPCVATFFVNGGKLDLQPGFRTVWKTRKLEP